MNKPSFIPQEETVVFVNIFDYFTIGGSVCVAEEDSMVILVTRDRVVYELNLQTLKLEDGILATTEGISPPYRPYCDSGYRISRNGSRIVELYIRCPEWSETEEYSAALHVGKTRLELKIFDLSGTADQVQIIELEYADPLPPDSHMHVITFSPDLSIVQAGADIVDLLAPGHPRLWFPDNPLEKPRQGEKSSITFSPCNRYLVLVQNKKNVATNGPATYGIFRIYRTIGKIEKVEIPGLDYLVADAFYADSHPELPLLVLTCFKRPQPGCQNAANHINAIEIDLETLKPTPIDIPKHRLDLEGM